MSKRPPKTKRRSKALPALGVAGVSLALAGVASASTSEAPTNIPSTSQSHEIFLGEEEISDASLATFYLFDKENVGSPPLSQKLRLAVGGGAGCGCGGCGAGINVTCAGWGGGYGGWQTQPPKKKPPHLQARQPPSNPHRQRRSR